jgi:hypothetical protein
MKLKALPDESKIGQFMRQMVREPLAKYPIPDWDFGSVSLSLLSFSWRTEHDSPFSLAPVGSYLVSSWNLILLGHCGLLNLVYVSYSLVLK